MEVATDNSVTYYTTSLAKGQALTVETIDLLRLWEPGMSADELAAIALQTGILGKDTAQRTSDVVKRVFRPRYLGDDGAPARYLKKLVVASVSHEVILQLMTIYIARAHPIFRDFVTDVFWSRYQAGASEISRDHAEDFIDTAYAHGRIGDRWSSTMRIRVARYLVGTLVDLGFASPKSPKIKHINRPYLTLAASLFLCHDLHFSGSTDLAIVLSDEWRLFGLTPDDVRARMQQLAVRSHFYYQDSGELVQISWKYATMEECLDVIADDQV